MSEPFLNDVERDSVVWEKIEAHYRQRLDELRQQNDSSLDGIKTAELRGRIREVKRLLSMHKEPDDGGIKHRVSRA